MYIYHLKRKSYTAIVHIGRYEKKTCFQVSLLLRKVMYI